MTQKPQNSDKTSINDSLAGGDAKFQDKLNLYKTIFDCHPAAILTIVDETGTILLVNQKTEAIFGYQKSELLGKKVEQLLPERLREKHIEYRTEYMENPTARPMGAGRDLYGLRKDGTEVPVEIALTPIKISGNSVILTTITDITVRKNLENQRDRALQMKDEIIGVVSHEIRNALTTFSTSTALLEKITLDKSSNTRIEKLFVQIKSAIHRMTRFTTDLLDVAKSETGHFLLKPGPVEITELIEDVFSLFEPIAIKKGIHLTKEINSKVSKITCDRDRIIQVISNLVSNSIKYTEKSGHISIKVSQDTDFLIFQVKDTGRGITEEELPHVLDKFWQAKDTQYKGTGLGLYISNKIILNHGGRLWVESTFKKGSTFYFTLPIAANKK